MSASFRFSYLCFLHQFYSQRLVSKWFNKNLTVSKELTVRNNYKSYLSLQYTISFPFSANVSLTFKKIKQKYYYLLN